MNLYTERYRLRKEKEQTYVITADMYTVLFDCCFTFGDYIAWKYPLECPDGKGVYGLNMSKLDSHLKFEIPTLYRNYAGQITTPSAHSEFDPFAIFDLIEFFVSQMRDIYRRTWHEYFKHRDFDYGNTIEIRATFRKRINEEFVKMGLLYTLTEQQQIERVVENGVLSEEIENAVKNVGEQGLKGLLQEAIFLHKSPYPADHKDAVEKIWDALERLKTYHAHLDKKQSLAKIIGDMSGEQEAFAVLFNDEFKALTAIGNDFRIRHHEINRTDILDDKHYDYFFNRCMSLISLALQYLT